jgi:glutamine amidotransferase
MSTVTLINYGLGNIQAFANIYKRLNIPVEVASTVSDLNKAERLILPGVGSFDWAMTKLNQSGLRDALDDRVLKHHVPVLGVCVGMQMMAHRSEEGVLPGLSWIDGDVVRFDQECDGGLLPLPHMGWNDVEPAAGGGCLFKGLKSPRFYFLHSYYIVPRRPEDVLATSMYHREFTSAVRSGHIIGTQFHPEKSHQWGIDLLRNFCEV